MKHVVAGLPIAVCCSAVLVMGQMPPASADPPAEAQAWPTQAAMNSAYYHKLICKRETVVGSYIRKPRCRTQAQIDEERAATKLWAEDMSRSSIRTLPGLRGPEAFSH